MGRVQDKVVFITGAGGGQGRAHALQLAREGADIVAVDVCRQLSDSVHYDYATEADLAETCRLVQSAGRRCLAVHADVRDADGMNDAAARAVQEFGRIDAVCANAGVCTFHKDGSLSIPTDVYDLIMDTNLKGVWNTIQATATHLIEAGGGSIVITSSVAGIRGQVPYAHYVASKHGIVGLMKAFANELAPHRVRVNTIHPTGVLTAMGTDRTAHECAAVQPLFRQGAANMLPDLDSPAADAHEPVSMLTAEEIAKTVLFLISDDARYITGVQLPVDAGNVNKP